MPELTNEAGRYEPWAPGTESGETRVDPVPVDDRTVETRPTTPHPGPRGAIERTRTASREPPGTRVRTPPAPRAWRSGPETDQIPGRHVVIRSETGRR